MKVSYKWLQEYIEEKLPPVDKVVEALTMHSFEVEGVEKVHDDKILDVKILPNKSHDCLSHYGIASEIASVLKLTRKEPLSEKPDFSGLESFGVKIEDGKLCRRMIAVLIKDVLVKESPEWMVERLTSMGQRPINNIVDITNYITLAFGQPMHAFDADTISGGNIYVRGAKQGEKITLLNDKEYTLSPDVLVIADEGKALDVAGVMGGKHTATYEKTKTVLLVVDNFDPVSIRKTSKKLGVRTDASVRFENDLSPALAEKVLSFTLKLVHELSGGTAKAVSDIYPEPQKETTVSFTEKEIGKILGVEIDRQIIISLLGRQRIFTEQRGETITATAPLERLDIGIVEDIAEEVGRLYGYEKISPAPLVGSAPMELEVSTYISNKLRVLLVGIGFSEVYTYAMVSGGDVEIENPLAGDKNFMRKNLLDGVSSSLDHNYKYMDLLGIKEIKIFEIGKVFTTKGESLHLSLGVKYPKVKNTDKADEEVARAIQAVEGELGVSFGNLSIVGGMVEIDLDKLIGEIKIPGKYPGNFWVGEDKNIVYKTISPYPFAVRDVAVFVPKGTEVGKVEEIIKKHLKAIVVKFSLFDTFSKDDKTSYAFRLIFQSQEKTLTDKEINAVMDSIYKSLKAENGFEIR